MNAKQIRTSAANGAEAVAENVILRLVARLAAPLALAAVAWAASQLVQIDKQIAEQSIYLNNTNSALTRLETKVNDRTSDRYTASDARRDWTIQEQRDDRQDTDRQRVERRVETLQNWLNPRP